jgi:hypothetical protein
MRVLNDFLCTHCNQTEEHFVGNLVTTVKCVTCNRQATKVQAAPNFTLPGNDPAGFPTAHANWERKRKRQIAHELKTNPES